MAEPVSHTMYADLSSDYFHSVFVDDDDGNHLIRIDMPRYGDNYVANQLDTLLYTTLKHKMYAYPPDPLGILSEPKIRTSIVSRFEDSEKQEQSQPDNQVDEMIIICKAEVMTREDLQKLISLAQDPQETNDFETLYQKVKNFDIEFVKEVFPRSFALMPPILLTMYEYEGTVYRCLVVPMTHNQVKDIIPVPPVDPIYPGYQELIRLDMLYLMDKSLGEIVHWSSNQDMKLSKALFNETERKNRKQSKKSNKQRNNNTNSRNNNIDFKPSNQGVMRTCILLKDE